MKAPDLDLHGPMLRRVFQILTGILAGLALVAGAHLAGWLPGGPEEPDPHMLSTPFPAPELRLTDHSGSAFSLAEAKGVTVLFFGFTHCPDVCPLTLAKLATSLATLEERAGSAKQRRSGPEGLPHVAFVTVDPARDTPDRLADYVESFHPDFLGLGGSEEDIARTAAAWGIYREVSDTGSDYTVDHTARSFVVDDAGMVRATFGADADAASMTRTLSRLREGR